MFFAKFGRPAFQQRNRFLSISAFAVTATSFVAVGSLYRNDSVQPVLADPKLVDDQKRVEFRQKWEETVKKMQSDICTAIEKVDGKAKFKLDEWKRAEGGGGWTRVLSEGQG